jgi:hypothetical protein
MSAHDIPVSRARVTVTMMPNIPRAAYNLRIRAGLLLCSGFA